MADNWQAPLTYSLFRSGGSFHWGAHRLRQAARSRSRSARRADSRATYPSFASAPGARGGMVRLPAARPAPPPDVQRHLAAAVRLPGQRALHFRCQTESQPLTTGDGRAPKWQDRCIDNDGGRSSRVRADGTLIERNSFDRFAVARLRYARAAPLHPARVSRSTASWRCSTSSIRRITACVGGE